MCLKNVTVDKSSKALPDKHMWRMASAQAGVKSVSQINAKHYNTLITEVWPSKSNSSLQAVKTYFGFLFPVQWGLARDQMRQSYFELNILTQ